jgi:hypothetical protein
MTYTYTLYGITLSVPFPCPALTTAPAGTVPDVAVVEGPVPRTLPESMVDGPNWQASPGVFLFRGGRNSGRFLVEGGERITLIRNPAAEEKRLCAHLLAAVMAALLRQRGLLVLHANVAITPSGAVAISGGTGAGKSTTQAVLLARGCRMVTDDITVLGLGQDGRVIALPGVVKMNLCEDAAARLGHDVASLPRNLLRSIKVIVPVVPDDILDEPVPLKTIYLLNCHEGSELNVTPLAGVDKFSTLQECIYGPLFPEEHHGLFPLVSAVATQVEIVRIDRPKGRWSANEIAERILHG